MGKIPVGKYSHMGDHKQGLVPSIVAGNLKAGGGKLGSGSGSLKKMMVWADKGKRSSY